MGYGVESDFGIRLVLLLAIVLLLLVSFHTIMRKWLNVERKKFLSNNYVNGKHKSIEWTIRIVTIVSLLLGYGINITRDPAHWYWFLQPWFILIIFAFVSQIVSAVMERKYAQNPNAYKVTISETIFLLILLITLFNTDFFGLI
ncbi:DUF4181 domain-containing protein [Ornithinibacillus sp. L9]|uniref:DUF4181 domain-containing protein n=1 Tax=Ornithinibacillus caprae TaxID=2678566 RepID=A0A6N8FE79_9BACI|nr:DUF4181 domain-containing protein [Ornithinibacillus caprae]MUK87830.1 DUF4181 domain-containing protein [Ornithinibacillus caprae]